MSWLLNFFYACFLVLASPWLLWRFLSVGKNKRGWLQKIFGWVVPRTSDHACIWMHAVSVGEVMLLAPIIDELKRQHPTLEIAISTTTESGFELATRKYSEHHVFFCPLDFTWAIKCVLKRIRPCMLVLAELELWPNLIRTTRRAGVPVAVVNGRLSANSLKGYQRFHWMVRSTFESLSVVAAQNENYAQRFVQLGCDPANVIVTGNVKFDGVETNRDNDRTRRLAQLAGIRNHDRVFVAGSTQVEEDLLAAQVYQTLFPTIPDLRLILVPRHPERCGTLVKQLEQLGIPTRLRSGLGSTTGLESTALPDSSQEWPQTTDSQTIHPVLIVDVIGELGAWWGCAGAAYVGGSLGRRGGQNMIEPSAFGLPVSFGPNTENFREIVAELLAHEGAVVIEDQAALQSFVERAFSSTQWAAEIGQRARNVVMTHLGASQRTVQVLTTAMDDHRLATSGSSDISTRAA